MPLRPVSAATRRDEARERLPGRLAATATAAGPLVFGYLSSGGALAAAGAAQLVTFAILARAFGPRQFGLYVQFTAGATIAVQLCGLGASDCLIRRVSRDRATYPALLGHGILLVLATGAPLVCFGVPIVQLWLRLDPSAAVAALLLVSNVVLMRLVLLVETIFLGIGRVKDANRSVVGFAFARTAIAALACLALGTTTIAQWAVVQFCGYLLYAAACLAWLKPLGAPHWGIIRAEIRPGLLYASQFVARAVRQNIDLFVLGAALPAAMVGSYAVARRILDASFLTIDAMNRLLYPRFARASRIALRDALPDALRALAAALLIGAATAATLYALAPFLPLAFGHTYRGLPDFLRLLCGLIAPVAVWSVALDLIGASGRQGVRASIVNAVNMIGSVGIVAATSVAAPAGTILALYATEGATALAAWSVLIALVQRDPAVRRDEEASPATPR